MCGHVALTAAGLDHHMDDSHNDLLVQVRDRSARAPRGFIKVVFALRRSDLLGAN